MRVLVEQASFLMTDLAQASIKEGPGYAMAIVHAEYVACNVAKEVLHSVDNLEV